MDRAPEPVAGDERSLILGWLAFYRGALEAKCEGLAPQDMVKRSAPPSALSILGLVRHLSEMERAYVQFALRGGQLDLRYSGTDPEGDMEGISVDDVESSLAAWREDCATSDALISGASLDETAPGDGYTVRWNLMKVLGEYARHTGHADIIRERIDGATGE
jgi:hypothetical protein